MPNPFSPAFTRSPIRRSKTPSPSRRRSILRPPSTRSKPSAFSPPTGCVRVLPHDIPNPGDYITYAINDQPIFVIRGKDGAIRSFSNVCLHRMMTLLEDSGNCGRITCPYHGWTYDTEGRVIGAGHMGKRDPEFDKKGYRLPELRTEIWHGWIYVTLNGDAPSVARLLAELEPRSRPLRPCRLHLRRAPGPCLEDQLEASHREFHGGLSSPRRAQGDRRRLDADRFGGLSRTRSMTPSPGRPSPRTRTPNTAAPIRIISGSRANGATRP